MAIRSDDQGFLIGEVIAGNRDIQAGQVRSLSMWRDIRKDVRSIARALGVVTTGNSRGSKSRSSAAAGQSQASAPARRGGAGANTSKPAIVAAPRRASSVRGSAAGRVMQDRDERGRFVRATPSATGRDARGRFVGGQGGGDQKPGDSASPGVNLNLSKVADRLGKVVSTLPSAEGVDPTLNAAREVGSVLSPVGRGLSTLFGQGAQKKKERAKERWYKKMWRQLTSPAFSKRRDAGSDAGFVGRLAERIGKAIGRATGRAGGAGGAMIGGAGVMMWRVISAVLSRIFLPVAALWGAFKLGQWIGEKINDWLNENRVVERLVEGFDAIKQSVSGTWNSVATWVQDQWKTATDAFGKVVASIASIPDKVAAVMTAIDSAIRGIPVVGKAYAAVVDTAKEAAAQAQAGFSNSPTAAPPSGVVATMARAVGDAVGRATDWVLGSTSKKYESGRGGAGTVSSGKGDNGGVSYGTYQLSSKKGTVDRFLRDSGYGAQFAGLTPGSAEFNARWKEIAKSDPKFGAAQHDFIRDTHYSPALSGLKGAGIDLAGRGSAVQDSLWSTSVQFGAGSAKNGNGAIGLISKALAGRNVGAMSDAEVIAAIQDYKVANNARLFASSDAKNRAGTLSRAMAEKQSLLALAQTSTPRAPSMASTDVPSSVPPKLPKPPELPEPRLPLNSQERQRQNIAVQLNEPIGQNVGDRSLAHIVTGGIGG